MPPIENKVTEDNVSSSSSSSSSGSSVIDENTNETVIIIRPKNQAPYVCCKTKNKFINPFNKDGKTPKEINETELNLYLGYEWLDVTKWKLLRYIIQLLDNICIVWWEKYLFTILRKIPVYIIRKIIYKLWYIYLPIHKFFLGKTTGIHTCLSYEFHAITTASYFSKLFPITIQRLRYFLDLVTAGHPTDIQSSVLETISVDLTSELPYIPDVQKDACTVSGIYLHHRPNNNSSNIKNNNGSSTTTITNPLLLTEYTLIWFSGGAFIGGTPIGYTGPADMIGTNCNMDVFIPQIRLCPDIEFHDVLWDACLAYRYVYNLRKRYGLQPNKIILLGISSGAGLASRLIQFFNEIEQNIITLPSYITPILQDLSKPIGGTVLISSYVNYNDDNKSDGSFFQYSKHDIIVTHPVINATIPYLDTNMNGERNLHSPKVHTFQGSAPICVLLSEHEACYDEGCDLINKARNDGVDVTVGMWRYVCHAWCFMHGFIPEGKEAMQFVCNWINKQKSKVG